MARPLRVQSPGVTYHLQHRAIPKQHIFRNDQGHAVFLQLLERGLDIYSVKLFGFVLLKNAFQLLVSAPQNNLGEFMRQFSISYTSWYNCRYKRKGKLFHGRFKSLVVQEERYQEAASRTIHLAPLSIRGMGKLDRDEKWHFLRQYRWSSLPGHLGIYPRYDFVDYNKLLAPLGGDTPEGRTAYSDQLFNQLEERPNLKKHIIGQAILGDREFADRILSEARHLKYGDEANSLIQVEELIRLLEQLWQKQRTSFLSVSCTKRNIAIDLLYRFTGLNNQKIANLLNIHYSTVSVCRKKLGQLRQSDRRLDAEIITIERRLKRMTLN